MPLITSLSNLYPGYTSSELSSPKLLPEEDGSVLSKVKEVGLQAIASNDSHKSHRDATEFLHTRLSKIVLDAGVGNPDEVKNFFATTDSLRNCIDRYESFFKIYKGVSTVGKSQLKEIVFLASILNKKRQVLVRPSALPFRDQILVDMEDGQLSLYKFSDYKKNKSPSITG
ncbi:MAG: hypothetical protein H0U27_06435, partial [Nitrosopumilus sp.]|nr:hypothetical protein [Nitrosopumilus sp.]